MIFTKKYFAFSKDGPPAGRLRADFGGPSRVILSAFAVFLTSQLVAVFLIGAVLAILGKDINILDQSAAAQFVYILFAEAIVLLSVYWILRRAKLSLSAIGLGRRPAWRDLKLALGGIFAFYGLLIISIAALTLLIPGFDADAPQDVGFNFLSTPMDRIIAFVALVILPPIGEEILIRGYLFSGLRSRLRFLPAMLLTSALFGAAHLATGVSGALWAAAVSTFVLSVVLVYLRERTGALYSPMMVHGFNNLVAFFIYIR